MPEGPSEWISSGNDKKKTANPYGVTSLLNLGRLYGRPTGITGPEPRKLLRMPRMADIPDYLRAAGTYYSNFGGPLGGLALGGGELAGQLAETLLGQRAPGSGEAVPIIMSGLRGMLPPLNPLQGYGASAKDRAIDALDNLINMSSQYGISKGQQMIQEGLKKKER
jgi:hypothetical protein